MSIHTGRNFYTWNSGRFKLSGKKNILVENVGMRKCCNAKILFDLSAWNLRDWLWMLTIDSINYFWTFCSEGINTKKCCNAKILFDLSAWNLRGWLWMLTIDSINYFWTFYSEGINEKKSSVLNFAMWTFVSIHVADTLSLIFEHSPSPYSYTTIFIS